MKVIIVHRDGQFTISDISPNRLPNVGDQVDFFESPFPTVSMLLRIYHESTLDGLKALLTTAEVEEYELTDIEMVIMVE